MRGSVDRCSKVLKNSIVFWGVYFLLHFIKRQEFSIKQVYGKRNKREKKMNVQLTNTAFELRITPNKRKRDDLKERRPQQNHYGNNKENHFIYNNFMEVKSIAELIESKNHSNGNGNNVCNPFEVVRKPPKKKNRKEYSDDGCFVNPALNLDGPENVVNPFEMKRAAPLPDAVVHNCFENTGLNICVEDRKVVNPFEVARLENVENPNGELCKAGSTELKIISHSLINILFTGIENPGLEAQSAALAISVPFTPTVGCRIDFKNIQIEDLTPSSMLNRHLVFSPLKKVDETTPKRPNLSVISEEAVDISKELESYQLEIENSMNEAKATNKHDNKNRMDLKRKKSFQKRLCAAAEDPALMAQIMGNVLNASPEVSAPQKNEEHSCHDSSHGNKDCPKSSTPKTPNENCIAKYSLDRSVSINENPDVVYEEVNESNINNEAHSDEQQPQQQQQNEERSACNQFEEDADLFKNPAPFVRAFRRDVERRNPSTARNHGTDIVTDKQAKIEERPKENHEVFSGIRSSIRKSIRKLIHPNTKNSSKNTEEVTPTKEQPNAGTSNNILTTIRHSLRRKQPKQPLATSTPRHSLNDISIIDTAEPRAIYKDTAFSARVNYVEENLLHRKNNLRSSLRRSTHAVKSVFKKNAEDYGFKK